MVGTCLGEGGFGITYRGFDLMLERKVAIKEYFPMGLAVRDRTQSSEVREQPGAPAGSLARGGQRFLAEARTLAHPKVGSAATSLDYLTANGTVYIVMEYVGDETLRDYVRRHGGRLALKELLTVTEPVFSTLEELHARGLVHLDVSPDNIVVGDQGARLVDFGLAREFAEEMSLPSYSFTYGYAPPEQHAGGGYGPWTDVYALSATLYECLTGEAPINSLDRIAGEKLPSLESLGVFISLRQKRALMRGLSLRVSNRIQSVAELWDGLRGKSALLGGLGRRIHRRVVSRSGRHS